MHRPEPIGPQQDSPALSLRDRFKGLPALRALGTLSREVSDWYQFSRAVAEKAASRHDVHGSLFSTWGAARPHQIGDISEAFGLNGWVNYAISTIAVNAGSVPWEVKRKVGPGEFEVIDKGPGVDLLKRPNPYCTGTELRESMVGWLVGDGNYYLEKVFNDQGRVTEIYMLDARRMRVVPDRENFIKGYLLDVPGLGQPVRFEPHQIVHGKLFNLLSPWYGMTPLAAMKTVVQSSINAEEWNKGFFENAAIPSGVIEGPSGDHSPNPDEVERLRKSFHQAHAGMKKAWRTAVLLGGMQYKVIQPTHTEMGFADLDEKSRDKILAIMGVPRPHFTDLNRSTSIVQDRAFWIKTVIPLLERAAMTLNAQFLPDFGRAHGLDFEADPEAAMIKLDISQIDALSELLSEQEEATNIAINNGSMLINEARERRGQDPLPWGDTWHGPLTIVALATLAKNAGMSGAIQRMVNQGLLPPEAAKDVQMLTGVETGMSVNAALALVEGFTKNSANSDSLPALLKSAVAGDSASRSADGCGDPPSLSPATAPKMIPALGSKERRDIIWKRFDTQLRPAEKGLERIARRGLNAQRDRINSRLKEWEASQKQDAILVTANLTVDVLFDTEEEAKAMLKLLTPHVTEVAAEFGQSALDQLGIDQEYDPTTETLRQFVDRRLTEMTKRSADSLFEQLGKLVTEAQAGDATVQELAKAIREHYDVQSKVRAARIARTETGSAANFAIIDGWEQSSVVVGKEWVSSRDKKVRDSHKLDGTVRRLDESFTVGGHPAEYPLDPSLPASEQVNCRCTTAPVIDEDMLAERGGARDPLFLLKSDVPYLTAA